MNGKPLLVAVALLPITACSPELSGVAGVSIKQCHHHSGGTWQNSQGRHIDEGELAEFLRCADPELRGLRLISSVDISGRYDLLSPPMEIGKNTEARAIVLKAVRETFGLSIVEETRRLPVLVLDRAEHLPLGLTPASPGETWHFEQWPPPFLCDHFPLYNLMLALRPYEPRTYTFRAHTIADLTRMLEAEQKMPVLDETHVGGMYNFKLVVDYKHGVKLADTVEQLGLRLTPVQRGVRAIYVDADPQATPTVSLGRLERPVVYWTPFPRDASNSPATQSQ